MGRRSRVVSDIFAGLVLIGGGLPLARRAIANAVLQRAWNLAMAALENVRPDDAPHGFHGPIRVGRDGYFTRSPANSKWIGRTNRLKLLFQG